MTLSEALGLCPQLLTVPPDKAYYGQKSEDIHAILQRFTPIIEPNSIDEAWLDMTGTESRWGDPREAARTIMETIWREEQLGCSIGIAPNKFLAKMASDMKKPNGITVLGLGDVETRLWPLPIRQMLGVGKRTGERMDALGIRTIGDLARLSPEYLEAVFGRSGREMHRHAHGLGSDVVEIPDADSMKSISRETTVSSNIDRAEVAKATLRPLAEDVARQARRHGKLGRTVQITLRYAEDLRRITRQKQVEPSDDVETIYTAGCKLVDQAWDPLKPVRLLGIGVTNFLTEEEQQASRQMGLDEWLTVSEQLPVISEIRQKLGEQAIFRGSELKRRQNERTTKANDPK